MSRNYICAVGIRKQGRNYWRIYGIKFHYLATHTAHTAGILLPSLVGPHVFFEVVGSMERSVWTDRTGMGVTEVTSKKIIERYWFK